MTDLSCLLTLTSGFKRQYCWISSSVGEACEVLGRKDKKTTNTILCRLIKTTLSKNG